MQVRSSMGFMRQSSPLKFASHQPIEDNDFPELAQATIDLGRTAHPAIGPTNRDRETLVANFLLLAEIIIQKQKAGANVSQDREAFRTTLKEALSNAFYTHAGQSMLQELQEKLKQKKPCPDFLIEDIHEVSEAERRTIRIFSGSTPGGRGRMTII